MLTPNEEILETLRAAGEVIPEGNYSAFAAYIMIVPYILKEAHSTYALPEPPVLSPIWNYVDAACTLVVGIHQLTDKTHHRPIVNKLKGAINIASGSQLIALTALGFGGPAFAAAFGVGFALSLDDTVRAIRRANDDDYLLKDNIAQVKKSNEQIQVLEDEIVEISDKIRLKRVQTPLGADDSLSCKLLQKMQLRKEKRLIKQKGIHKKLEDDIYGLLVLKKDDGQDIHEDTAGMLGSPNVSHALKTKLDNLNRTNVDVGEVRLWRRHKTKMNLENRKAIREAIFNNIVWGMAFVGMLLVCIPGMQVPGLAIVAAASVIYLAKNASKIKEKIGGFFSHKKESPQSVDAASQLTGSESSQLVDADAQSMNSSLGDPFFNNDNDNDDDLLVDSDVRPV